jgi:hypothetical protein
VLERAVIQAQALVGGPDEQRVPVGLGVQRDHTRRSGPIHAQLARGVDDTHCGLAAAGDRQA